MNKNMRKMYTEEEIKDIVNYAIEKGLIDNAKPIYCHPIVLTSSSSTFNGTRIAMLLFNNESEAYTKTSFLAYLDDFVGNMIVTGFISLSGDLYIPSYFAANGNIVSSKVSDGTIAGISIQTMINDSNVSFADNVHKIN